MVAGDRVRIAHEPILGDFAPGRREVFLRKGGDETSAEDGHRAEVFDHADDTWARGSQGVYGLRPRRITDSDWNVRERLFV